jgi:hypothetical protein
VPSGRLEAELHLPRHGFVPGRRPVRHVQQLDAGLAHQDLAVEVREGVGAGRAEDLAVAGAFAEPVSAR